MAKRKSNRSGSSQRWLERQRKDPFVRQSLRDGSRSRAVFKLSEIADTDHLLRRGDWVVDLGAAPGGWSQLAAQKVAAGRAGGGRVIALDLLEMAPISGVEFIQGDFLSEEVATELEQRLEGRQVDLVLSDIAPNFSGVRITDQANAERIADAVVMFARDHLRDGGSLIIKVFEGQYVVELRRVLSKSFARVRNKKPAASRSESSELYLVALGYDGIV